MTTTKINCTRCNGSGSYSFNLRDGSKCYGCMGQGFTMVDAAKHAKAAKARAARASTQQAQAARRTELAQIVCAELDATFGPFANTVRGAYDRVTACQRAFGKTPGDMVQERLAA